ncbi:hypothetical protein CPC08DRAFT_703820 [Agrocybe pediades]|nr:hypothetical protein CPC08DRAFT_703820 [Agrocybe pediades]
MPTPCFIEKIPNDVLVHIFGQLLDVVSWGPWKVDNLRIASHVCARWRHLVLQSAWLWARLIDVGIMGKWCKPWREEFMERTGCAMLHVYGHVETVEASDFLDTIMSKYWARVQHFDMLFCKDPSSTVMDTIFLQQAPNLVTFDFKSYVDLGEALQSGQQRTLFHNYAPALRVVSSNSLVLPTNAPSFFRGLTCLEMPISSSSSASEVLNVLKATPLLQKLVLALNYRDKHIPSRHHSNSLHPVHLQDLREIDIQHTLPMCSALIPNIHFQGDKPLRIARTYCCGGRDSRDALDLSIFALDFATLVPVFVDHCRSIVSSWTWASEVMPRLEITITNQYRLRVLLKSDILEPVELNMGSYCEVRNLPADPPFEQLWTALSTLDFNNVRVMELFDISSRHRTPKCAAFFLLFSSIKKVTLFIDNDNSGFVVWLLILVFNGVGRPSDHEALAFPSLTVLSIVFLSSRPPASTLHSIVLFLAQRKERGQPIQLLELSMDNSVAEVQADCTGLDTIEGLVVHFNSEWSNSSGYSEPDWKYVCGSGNPSRLHFELEDDDEVPSENSSD